MQDAWLSSENHKHTKRSRLTELQTVHFWQKTPKLYRKLFTKQTLISSMTTQGLSSWQPANEVKFSSFGRTQNKNIKQTFQASKFAAEGDLVSCTMLHTFVSVSDCVSLTCLGDEPVGSEAGWALSVGLYSTRVGSCSLGSGIQLQEVPVARRAAEPRFAEMNGAGQKVHVCPGGRAAPLRNVDAAPPAPPSGCAPHKRAALLSKEPAQSRHGRGVLFTGTSCHAFKTANASYKHTVCW